TFRSLGTRSCTLTKSILSARGLLPELPPALPRRLVWPGLSRAFQADRLLHRRLQGVLIHEVLEELPLDRPALSRQGVAAQDVVHQGQATPARPPRELRTRHQQQF